MHNDNKFKKLNISSRTLIPLYTNAYETYPFDSLKKNLITRGREYKQYTPRIPSKTIRF